MKFCCDCGSSLSREPSKDSWSEKLTCPGCGLVVTVTFGDMGGSDHYSFYRSSSKRKSSRNLEPKIEAPPPASLPLDYFKEIK